MRLKAFYLLAGLIAFCAIEVASYLTAKVLVSKGALYQPFASDSYEAHYSAYLQTRDKVLGWSADPAASDSSGSRVIPAFPDPERHRTCVSVYGDSFTFSDEVSAKQSWANVLSRLLDCRVANFGVGGYGTDQAFLRFQGNGNDASSVVILNHASLDVLRNVNQFRRLLIGATHAGGTSFKPRFALTADESLELVSVPTFRPDEFEQVSMDPARHLAHDHFVPGGPSGLVRVEFPYLWSVLRGLGHFHVKAWLTAEPWYMDFYRPDHSSRALQITAAIMRSFHREATRQGRIPLLTVIPTGLSLRHFVDTGLWPYQPLIDELEENGMAPLDFGKHLMRRVGSGNPCALFRDCGAHFNEDGYRLLAEIAFEELQRRGLVPIPHRSARQLGLGSDG